VRRRDIAVGEALVCARQRPLQFPIAPLHPEPFREVHASGPGWSNCV